MTDVLTRKVVANEEDLNRDPITGTPGAHPLGTGAGAASGAVAGGVAGLAVGGPVGGLIGVAVGAMAGGLAGKSAAEAFNPTAEEVFWRETYLREPYYVQGRNFEYYAPGFRAGWEGRVRHSGLSFEEAEPELRANYDRGKGELDPVWMDVKPAARAAWSRVEQKWRRSP
ncbi:MAG: hypothetical protein WAO95_16940 [Burkholderiales bacterium]